MATITVPSLEDVILQRMQGRTRGGLMDDPEYMHRAELEETLLLNQQANKDKPIPEIPSVDITQGLFGIGSEAVKTGLNLGSRALELGERIAAPIVDLQRRTGERERSVLSDVTFQRAPGAGLVNNLPTYIDAFLPTLTALGSTALGGVQSISNYLNRVGADIAWRGPLPEGGREDVVALQPSDVRDIPRIQQQYTYQPRTDVGRFMTEVPQVPFHLITRASELVEDAVAALGVSPERSRAIGAAAEIAALYFADRAFRGTVRSIGKDIRELNGYLRDASIDNAYQSAQKILAKTNKEELTAARTRLTQTLNNITTQLPQRAVEILHQTAPAREFRNLIERLRTEDLTPVSEIQLLDQINSAIPPGVNKLEFLQNMGYSPNEANIINARLSTLERPTSIEMRNLQDAVTKFKDPNSTRAQRIEAIAEIRNITQSRPLETFGLDPALQNELAPLLRVTEQVELPQPNIEDIAARDIREGFPVYSPEGQYLPQGAPPTAGNIAQQRAQQALREARAFRRGGEPPEPLPVEPPTEPVGPTAPTVTPEPRPTPPSETALDILADPSASPAAQSRALSEIKRMALDAAPGKLAEGLRILGLDEALLPRLRNVRAAKAPVTPRATVGDVISKPTPSDITVDIPPVTPRANVTPEQRGVLDAAFADLADPNIRGIARRDAAAMVAGVAERLNVPIEFLPNITPEQILNYRGSANVTTNLVELGPEYHVTVRARNVIDELAKNPTDPEALAVAERLIDELANATLEQVTERGLRADLIELLPPDMRNAKVKSTLDTAFTNLADPNLPRSVREGALTTIEGEVYKRGVPIEEIPGITLEQLTAYRRGIDDRVGSEPHRTKPNVEITPEISNELNMYYRELTTPHKDIRSVRRGRKNIADMAERLGVGIRNLPGMTPELFNIYENPPRVSPPKTITPFQEYQQRLTQRNNAPQPDLVMGEMLRRRGLELTEGEFNAMRAEVNALEPSPQTFRNYLSEYLSRSTSTPPVRDYIQVTSLRDLTTGTPGEFSRTAPVQLLREGGKPTSIVINENTLNTKSLPQVQAETARLEQAGASERVKQINVMEQAKTNAKAELFGISPEEASRINGVELRNRLIKLAVDNNLDMYKVTREGLEQIPRNVVETSAKLNDGDLSNPKKITQEDRAQYMSHEANERSPFTYDEIKANLAEGIDISSQLPPRLAELYGRALQYKLSQLETPNRRAVSQILRSIKNLVNNERGAIGNIELSPEQKQAYNELRNDAIRFGRDITRLIRGDPRLSTVEKRLFEEYARSTNAPPPKPYLVLNDMAFDSEAALRGDFVIKRSKGEVEGTFNPEIYYSDWLGVAAPDDIAAPEVRTNFQKVARPESIQTATRKLLNAGQDAIVHAYRGVEQNLIKDRADYMRAITRIRRTFSEEQQRAIGADLFLNEGSIDLLIESNVEPRTLNSKEITGAQFVRSVFEELLPRLQEVRKNTGRGPMDVVPDYITHMRASNINNAFGTETSMASDAANVISERYANLKNTPFPFERTRRGGKFPAEMNAFDILETYVDYALRQIHMGPFVAKIHELIDTPIIDPSTNKTWNMKSEKPVLYQYMKDWNNYIAGKPQESIPEPWNKLLFATSRSLGNAYIAGNPLSAIIQPTSLFNTQMKVGMGTTIQAALNYMADLVNPRHPLRKFRLENSKSLDVRNPDIFFDEAGAGIVETLLENTPYLRPLGRAATKTSGAIGNYGTKPLRWLDQVSAEITWDAGYEFAKRAGKTGEDAFNVADDIVTLTQGSALRGERSPLQRTQKGRALTQFQTFAINNYDFLTNEVLGIDNKNMTNAQSVRNVMKLIGTGTLLNILIEDVGGGTSPVPNPPLAFLRTLANGPSEGQTEGQYLAELAFGSTLGELVKVIPMASAIRSRKGQLGGPIASFITDLGRAALGQPGTHLARTITRSLIPGGLQIDKALLAPEKENTKSFRSMEQRSPRK